MLNVRLLEPQGSNKPELLCVLCHGYGAPGDDLVGIGPELIAIEPRLQGRVAFAFPEAPLEIPGVPFGKAWWQIDVSRFQRALETGELDELFEETPPGMPEAREALATTLAALQAKLGIPMAKTVLGGFSQGAMLATDLALRARERPAALAILSGTLLSRSEWQRLAPSLQGMPVLQSHGTVDPILPYPAAKELERLLVAAGVDVGFVTFRGGHGIDGNVIQKLAQLVAARLP